MKNTNTILNSLLAEALPVAENWLRQVIRDEVRRTIEEERQKARPERYLSRDEVCQLIGISKPTLWKKWNGNHPESYYPGASPPKRRQGTPPFYAKLNLKGKRGFLKGKPGAASCSARTFKNTLV